MRRASPGVLATLCAAACASASPATPAPPARPAAVRPRPRPATLVVIGTADLHGHLETLPLLGGYLANLRSSGRADAVLLLDGGDMFQGTLESNRNEGAAVVDAYNHLGYTAVAIGNHEFDFGPAGERAVPGPGDDPRGALKARAAEARFPFLAANLVDTAAGQEHPVAWPNVAASALIEAAGVPVGLIGVATESTPRTTMPKNFAGLAVAPLAPIVAAEAAALRRRGARIVLVAAHAGGTCRDLGDPTASASCDPAGEIFQVARALPAGAVDVIVAGHQHAGIAHEVNGIAIIESFSNGVAFGRVDLVVEPGGRVSRRIHPPRFLCRHRDGAAGEASGDGADCDAGRYEGRPVEPDAAVAALIAPAAAAARELRESRLGVALDSPIRRAHREESALGNLFADLMREARPDGDVAITNGGGLRADLPAGELTYGALHRSMPFDNRFARVRLTGAQLARVIAANLQKESGIFSLSGVRAEARCRGGELVVSLRRERGGRVRDGDRLVLVTSDFLASGGDDMLAGLDLPADAVQFEDGPTIRDAMAGVLRARGGHLRGDDRRLLDPRAPRIDLPGRRPVRCR